ncbi:MAG: GNAT family N-acetyltransferase [Promethearchaeota archaeon]
MNEKDEKMPEPIKNQKHEEIRPVLYEEYDKVKDLIALSFAKDPGNYEIPGFIEICLESEEFFWGVFIDGEPVSGTMLVPFQFHIGDASFQVLGLTGVATHPDHRHKGYAYRMINKIHEYAFAKGYDGCVLHSAADLLYRKLGYEHVFNDWQISLKLSRNNIEGNFLRKIEKFIKTKKGINANHEQIQQVDIIEVTNKIFNEKSTQKWIIEILYRLYSINSQWAQEDFKLIRSRAYLLTQVQRYLEKNSEQKLFLFKFHKNSQISNTESKAYFNKDSIFDFVGYAFVKFQNDRVQIGELIVNEFFIERAHNLMARFLKFLIDYYCNNYLMNQNSEGANENKENAHDKGIISASIRQSLNIIVQTKKTDGLINDFFTQIGGDIYKIFISGNMASLFNLKNILYKLIPVFSKRWADFRELLYLNETKYEYGSEVNPLEMKIMSILFNGLFKDVGQKFKFILEINEDDKGRLIKAEPMHQAFTFELLRTYVDLYSCKLNGNETEAPIIRINREDIIPMIFGFVSPEDLDIEYKVPPDFLQIINRKIKYQNKEDFQEIDKKEIKEALLSIMMILFPNIEPTWDFLYEY